MSNMPDVNKRQVSIRVEIDLCRKVEKEFTRPGDKSKNLAYIRALEEATRKIKLDADDYALITQEVKANEAKRRGE